MKKKKICINLVSKKKKKKKKKRKKRKEKIFNSPEIFCYLIFLIIHDEDKKI